MNIYLLSVNLDDDRVGRFVESVSEMKRPVLRCTAPELLTHLKTTEARRNYVTLIVGTGEALFDELSAAREASDGECPIVLAGPNEWSLRSKALSAGASDYLDVERVNSETVGRVELALLHCQRHRELVKAGQRNRRLEALLQAQSEIASLDIDLAGLMQTVAECAQSLTEADGAVVEEVEGDEMVYRAATGMVADHVGMRLNVATSLSGRCVQSGEVFTCEDTETDDRVDRLATRRLGIRSMLVTPLQHGDRVLGVLKVSSAQPAFFDDLDVHTLRLMADVISKALAQSRTKQAQAELLQEAARARESLRETTSRLQAIVESAPLAICGYDAQRRITFWNPAAERLLGWTASEIVGQRVPQSMIPESCLDEYQSSAKRVLDGASVRRETQRYSKDGQLLDVEIASAPYFDEGRGLGGVISTMMDIGDRVRLRRRLEESHDVLQGQVHERTMDLELAQEILTQRRADTEAAQTKLTRSEQRFRTMFENAGVAISLVGADGRWLEINRQLCDIVGYSKDELMQLTFKDITHPDDMDADLRQTEKLVAGDIDSYAMDKRYVRKDGRVVWVSLTATAALRDENGHLTEAVKVARNIDARKSAENRLRLFERAVRASVHGVLISDARQDDLPAVYVNPAFEALTGYRSDEVLGRNCRFLQGPAQDPAQLNPIREAVAKGEDGKVVVKNYRKDGTEFLNELSVAPVRDESGEITHFVGIQHDVTQQIRAEAELRKAYEQLEVRVEERTAALREAYEELDRNETHLRDIAASVPGVLFEWYARSNGESGFSYLSPNVEDFYGLAREEMMADWTRIPFHPDDLSAAMASIQRAVQTQSDWFLECRVLQPDGKVRWLRNVSKPVRSDEEETVFIGLILDATDDIEARIRLAESESRFRALAEGSIEGVIVTRIDRDFELMFVNPAAANILGFESPDEMMALPSVTFLIPEPVKRRLQVHWKHLFAGEIKGIHETISHFRKDGEEIVLEVLGTSVDWSGEAVFQMTLIDVTERIRAQEALTRMAVTDEITGLPNRRQMNMLATQEVTRARRHPINLVALMMDIDHFKFVNDTYGHAAGDAALREVAGLLRQATRDSDIVARWGGEEFVAVLLGDNEAQAKIVGERFRRLCEENEVDFDGKRFGFTVSVGISSWQDDEPDMEAALNRADKALYRAKRGGRNRVVCYQENETST